MYRLSFFVVNLEKKKSARRTNGNGDGRRCAPVGASRRACVCGLRRETTIAVIVHAYNCMNVTTVVKNGTCFSREVNGGTGSTPRRAYGGSYVVTRQRFERTKNPKEMIKNRLTRVTGRCRRPRNPFVPSPAARLSNSGRERGADEGRPFSARPDCRRRE